MTKELITLNIVSHEGHTVLDLVPAAALQEIQDRVKNENKWVYIDGDLKNEDTLTVEDLNPEQYILLGNMLAGGDDEEEETTCACQENCACKRNVPVSTAYRTSFDLEDLNEATYQGTININAGQRIIDIVLNSDDSVLFIRNCSRLEGALRETLNNLAASQIKEVSDRLGMNTRAVIKESSYRMVVSTSIMGQDHDITLTFNAEDNEFNININEPSLFKILKRRNFIVHLFGSKLRSLGQRAMDQITDAVSVER